MEPAVARTAIGADIENRQGYTLTTGSGSLTIGVHLRSTSSLEYDPSFAHQRDPHRKARRRRQATGDMIIVRYADDIVVGFEKEAEARRFWDAMRARLREFSLSLHPEKTRLIEFGRFAAVTRTQCGLGKPETFSFLGFTLICGKTRQGQFQLKRKTRPMKS